MGFNSAFKGLIHIVAERCCYKWESDCWHQLRAFPYRPS